MRSSLRPIVLAAMALLMHSAVRSQTPGEAPPVIRLQFSVFEVNNLTPAGVRFEESSGRSRELGFNAKGRSRPYTYEGTPRLHFFRENSGPDGTVVREPLSHIDLPLVPPSRVLILFMRHRNGTWTTLWMDDTPEAFPSDTLKVFNATGTTLFSGVGEERFTLPVGVSSAIAFPRRGRNGLPVGFAVQLGEDELHLVYAHNLEPIPGHRTLLVVTPPRRASSLRVRTWAIDERIEGSEPPP